MFEQSATGARGGGKPKSARGGGAGAGTGRGARKNHAGPRDQQTKRENILDLAKYLDKRVQVKFMTGREVSGVLKGFDQLTNMVLDDTVETIRDISESEIIERTRNLGLVVARGVSLLMIAPAEGNVEIDNPFVANEE